ncbi:hypothetical protein [Methylobacterium sp. 1030]|uniref:hypothetical protein n=1 Tax=Methylobacterium sp. 1030 TaxID=3156404 RepID=UPI003391F01C
MQDVSNDPGEAPTVELASGALKLEQFVVRGVGQNRTNRVRPGLAFGITRGLFFGGSIFLRL